MRACDGDPYLGRTSAVSTEILAALDCWCRPLEGERISTRPARRSSSLAAARASRPPPPRPAAAAARPPGPSRSPRTRSPRPACRRGRTPAPKTTPRPDVAERRPLPTPAPRMTRRATCGVLKAFWRFRPGVRRRACRRPASRARRAGSASSRRCGRSGASPGRAARPGAASTWGRRPVDGRTSASASPRLVSARPNVRVGVAATRLSSAERPRPRRRDSSQLGRTSASPRLVSAEHPRRGRGVAATRLRGLSASRPRRRTRLHGTPRPRRRRDCVIVRAALLQERLHALQVERVRF